MMLMLEIISLCLMVCLCIICTRSDLRTGFIYNKVLAVFLVLAVVIDVIYYGLFVNDLLTDFLINIAVVAIVSLYLFYTHSFAGGDCKMTIVASLLFPARYYWELGNSNITLVFAIAFALFAGYCYLLGDSLWSIAKKKVVITFDYVKQMIFSFLKSYIAATVYISLFNSILMTISNYIVEVNVWFIRLMCLIVAWCIGRFPVFKKWGVFIPAACVVILVSVVTKTSPVSLNLENYVLVLLLLLCQMTIKTTIYEKVEVSQLKKGMILTTLSSVLMQKSITKGLPGVSTEDLRSRLTEDEISSIKIWAKATRTDSLMIVKKIPFAIFISIGFLLYCTMWGILL